MLDFDDVMFALVCVMCLVCMLYTRWCVRVAGDSAICAAGSSSAARRHADRAETAATRASVEGACAEECVTAVEKSVSEIGTAKGDPTQKLKLFVPDSDPLGLCREM